MGHFKITFLPDNIAITIHSGATILEAASQAGIILNTVCGGQGVCGKCRVKIEAGGEVPACQYRIEADLAVTIPQASRFYEQKILIEGIESKVEAECDIYKKYLRITTGDIFGLAIDIGTTTVVVKLVDMKTGAATATAADTNPQSIHGDDVISRIQYGGSDEGLSELNGLIVGCINRLIEQVCKEAKIRAEQIYEAAVVGNTTMNHIFLRYPIETLGKAPYKAYDTGEANNLAERIGLKINPKANIYTAPLIAGFVGADTVGSAIAADIENAEEITMLVDIGTNGEIVIGDRNRLLAASCAAGPAFEGGRISCGSRAVAGAIESVVFNGDDIEIDVTGGGEARSICGSGLLDAAAVMLELGVIGDTGRFAIPEKIPEKIRKRLTLIDKQPAFVLYDADAKEVYITQSDVRQLQLAKAAIRAGTKILQKHLGIGDEDIVQIFLAGAFGNYLRRESAVRIGLLPAVAVERIQFIGNAALSGAHLILISSRWRKRAGEAAEKIEYIELAKDKEFENIFADSMILRKQENN